MWKEGPVTPFLQLDIAPRAQTAGKQAKKVMWVKQGFKNVMVWPS